MTLTPFYTTQRTSQRNSWAGCNAESRNRKAKSRRSTSERRNRETELCYPNGVGYFINISMPSIPQDGTNGRLWNLVHANVRDAVSRSLYNISAAVETNDERPYGLHYFPGEDFTMKASSLGSYNSVNGSAIETMGERRALQILATVTSSISLITALLAMYWFCMMRRNFRRDLVLLLIIGGSWKSLWFMLYSVVTFTRGPIETTNPFCQVSGYGLVLGFESCGE